MGKKADSLSGPRWKIRLFKKDSFPLKVVYAYHEAAVGVHYHDFAELAIVEKGFATHFVENTEEKDIQAGDVLYIPPHVRHGYKINPPVKLLLCNIIWEPGELKLPSWGISKTAGYKKLFDSGGPIGLLQLNMDELSAILDMASAIDGELGSARIANCHMAGAIFLRLLGELSRFAEEERSLQELSSGVKRALAFLESSSSNQKMTLDEVAAKAKMSRSALIRAFRKELDCTPFERLMKIRLANAASLLESGGDSIGEIALRCGFSDGNHLSRQFKKAVGVSPKDYRKGVKKHLGDRILP